MELVCQSKLRLDGLKTADLEKYEGLDIKDICSTGLDSGGLNHCAHFVSHALNLGFGMLCGNMSWDTKGQGVCIRVDEIFNRCKLVGTWSDRPLCLKPCLAFVTPATNIQGSHMGSSPKKHIGIFIDDKIWHYSNGSDKVVTDSPERFLVKFKGLYGPKTQLYFGVLGNE
jgi:hypothetical protein